WLILLPLLIATVLLGQLYFLLQPDTPARSAVYDFLLLSKPPREVLLSRIVFAAWPLVGLAGWVAWLTIPWLYNSAGIESGTEANRRWWESRQWWASPLGIGAVPALIGLAGWFAYTLQNPAGESDWYFILNRYPWERMIKVWGSIWAVGAAFLLVYSCRLPQSDGLSNDAPKGRSGLMNWLLAGFSTGASLPGDTSKMRRQRKRRIRRNEITRLHSKLLVTFTVLTAILAFSGFGHELVTYMIDPPHDGWLAKALVKGGGWGSLIASIGGAIFTAVKGSPAGG